VEAQKDQLELADDDVLVVAWIADQGRALRVALEVRFAFAVLSSIRSFNRAGWS
jgi:hypothetical protein